MGFTEIHFHLLPGLDDGPASMLDSVALATAAAADGTRLIVATPHVHPAHITDPGEIAGHVRSLGERLADDGIGVALRPGGELAHTMVPRLTDGQLEQIAQGPPGRRWVLLEVPFEGAGGDFAGATAELRRRGFGVVLAHPERARATPAGDAVLAQEWDAGSVAQITAGSIAGTYGRAAQVAALALLGAAPCAVIASDAHGAHRPPELRAALEALAAGGHRHVSRLAGAIPRALLDRGLPSRPLAAAA